MKWLLLLLFLARTTSVTIRRIAVIGGGPCGLALAAGLKRLNSEVEQVIIFESRADITSTALGGGVQLTGGAKVCELIGILPPIDAVAEKLQLVIGRNDRGDELLRLDTARAVLKSNNKDLLSITGQPMLYSIMRSSLQQILFDATQSPVEESALSTQVTIRTNQRVEAVQQRKGQYEIALADGSVESGFDMVFGCDGVKSVVRDYIFADNAIRSPLAVAALNPRYSGLRVGFALTGVDKDFTLRPGARGAFHQWFGDGAYALEASYGSLAGPSHMVGVVYRDSADATYGANADWSENKLLAQFQRRLESSGLDKVRGLQTLMGAVEESRCIDIGVRDALLPLPAWSSRDGRVVILGDSAHAMAPFLGQGANQALQDAYVLAVGIKQINQAVAAGDDAIITMAKDFEGRRKGFTSLLRAKSSVLGQLETLGTPAGVPVKEAFFRFSNFAGVAEKCFLFLGLLRGAAACYCCGLVSRYFSAYHNDH